MATRKRTPEPPKRAGGPTQPEGERKAEQVKLRLLPATKRALDALAQRRGQTRSEAVAGLVEAADEGSVDRG